MTHPAGLPPSSSSMKARMISSMSESASKPRRRARPGLKLGICGEHGGDPPSIRFCHAVGLDYVSCSPYRVPIAKLAAAQAALVDAS